MMLCLTMAKRSNVIACLVNDDCESNVCTEAFVCADRKNEKFALGGFYYCYAAYDYYNQTYGTQYK